MRRAHETGLPPMSPLRVDVPDDPDAANIDDQFSFGDAMLVAPILEHGAESRAVYLPLGAEWRSLHDSSPVIIGDVVGFPSEATAIPL